MLKKNIYTSLVILITLSFIGCESVDDYELLKPEDNEELSGGALTVFDQSVNAFGFQVPGLKQQESLDFFVGNSLFNKNWVMAPSSTTARDGLGPLFNSKSCSGCHFKDGRGRPPYNEGEFGTGMLIRLSVGNHSLNGPIPDPNYGGQLQDQSIPGIPTEATFKITYEIIKGTYPDGNTYELRKPTYHIKNLTQGTLNAQFISPRVANQMIGLGLLEAIPEEDILKNADENDANNDGISGRPNYVTNVEENKQSLGRFGWKANQPNIKQQVAGAFSGDMGLTSSIFPDENIPPSHKSVTIPNGGTPEITDKSLEFVTLYSATLAVPARRNWEDLDVLKGKQLFEKINCTACHIKSFTTGKHPIAILSNQKIRPYTDLLLHDMGEGLADNSPDYLASGREWRTAPLWGTGLINTVNNHQLLLHDGRARNVEEAILWHGGEAENIKQKFMQLHEEERKQLILFINSL